MNQSGSAKETVSPKTDENIEMSVWFISMGAQEKTWYQSSLSNYNEST